MKTRTTVLLLSALCVLFSCRKETKRLAAISACFSIVRDTVYVGDTVLFSSCTVNADTFLYTFGDGSNSTLANPMHIFAHSGSYVVSLRVAAQSQSNTTSKTIVVKTAVPAAAAWRFFAPGSNVDSAVFYGMGSGAFNLAAHDIVNAGATPPGHFTQGDSFVVSYVMSPPSLTVYAQGTFLNNDSAVSMKYTTIIYPASGPPAIYDSGVFYGIRKW